MVGQNLGSAAALRDKAHGVAGMLDSAPGRLGDPSRGRASRESDRSWSRSLVDSDLEKLIKSFADLGPRVFPCIALQT